MSSTDGPRRVHRLRVVRKLPSGGPGFLTLTRLRLRNVYEDGTVSRPYRFEMVERRGVDSVALIPFFRQRGRIRILMKAGFRPALYLRGRRPAPGEGRRPRRLTVEAVAGSLEPGEVRAIDIDRRAVKELAEEAGLSVRRRALFSLGAGFFPSHGQCTEKVHLRGVEVDPEIRTRPPGDGSVNEAETWILALEAGDLLRRCRIGEVEDPKLEIGTRRLLEKLEIPLRRRGGPGLRR